MVIGDDKKCFQNGENTLFTKETYHTNKNNNFLQ